jgi:tetratricopeptide (TPR) repeat protein
MLAPMWRYGFGISMMMCLAGCVLWRGTFGQGEEPPDQKLSQRLVEETPPVQVDPDAARADGVRVLRLHVYADQDYRREVIQWKSRFRTLVGRANAYLSGPAGLHLEVAELTEWTRRTPVNQQQRVLEELEARDPGSAQVLVVGLITSMALAASSFDDLGLARLNGTHFYLRNMNDAEEYEWHARAHPKMSDDEKQRTYHERKAHKELVVFLHELGHVLGAEHERVPGTIMYPSYFEEMKAYSAGAVVTVRGNVIARIDGAQRELETAHADAAERESIQDLTYRYEQATRLATDAERLAALIAIDVGLGELPDGDAGRVLWSRLAQSYQQFDAVSLAARAAHRAGGTPPAQLSRWLAQTRARFALPDEGAPHAVAVAEEPAYLAHMRDAVKATARADYQAARAIIRAGKKRFANAPGPEVVLCDLDIRQQRWKTASRHCAEALRRYDGASWAHYLMAMIAGRDQRNSLAIKHLERAIELDPELVAARQRLAELRARP